MSSTSSGTPASAAAAALRRAIAAAGNGLLSAAEARDLADEFRPVGQTRDYERDALLWSYQHGATRRHIFLDDAGRAYWYAERHGRYEETPVRDALARARTLATV